MDVNKTNPTTSQPQAPITQSPTHVPQRIHTLRAHLHEWNHKYFVENAPTVSDSEYDQCMKELKELEAKHPEFYDPHSPSQRLGETPLQAFKTLEHSFPMKSLGNIYSTEELVKFHEHLQDTLSKSVVGYTVEPKIDGVSIAIRYKNGVFQEALTRGDGHKGDDVTTNVKTIRSIPLRLKQNITIEVRGEVFFPGAQFHVFTNKQAEKGERVFANPRNAAAGSLKLLDSKEAAKRPLDAFFYQIAEGLSQNLPKTQWKRLKYLHFLGFKTNPHNIHCKTLQQVIQRIQDFSYTSKQLDYDIDGLVIKINSIQTQEELGYTAKEPRWATAYKYPSKQASTQIQSISLSVGKHGNITPVAHFTPVLLSGTLVSKASLHNFTQIKNKDIRVHDWVFVQKGGEIIPQVTQVILEKRCPENLPFATPTECPSCKTRLHERQEHFLTCSNEQCPNQSRWKPDSTSTQKECPSCSSPTQLSEFLDIRCLNEECPEQRLKKIIHFCSKQGLNIEGLGEQNIRVLLDKGLVQDVADLYSLHNRVDELMQLDGFQEKSITNLLQSITNSKEPQLSEFIHALGVPHLGQETSKLLASKSNSLDNLLALTQDSAILQAFGPITQESILKFFTNEHNQALITKLHKAGLKPRSPEHAPENNTPFTGKSFTLTGTLTQYTRNQIIAIIQEQGGQYRPSLSKASDILIAGAQAGQKLSKAQALGIPIWTEDDLLKALNPKQITTSSRRGFEVP